MTAGCTGLGNYKLIYFDKIDSTQTYAHDIIARNAAQDHVAVCAGTQTRGRGRYRRNWVSNRGNLYVSFIYECKLRDSRLAYAVAVAVAETMIEFNIAPQIKWPNDVLIGGAKAAGILIEYVRDFVVVGIGINIKSAPNIEKYRTAKMGDYTDAAPRVVLGRLMKNMDRWMAAPFPDVRARWMELAAGLNHVVKYRGQDAELVGINGDGALILHTDDGDFLAYGDEISI